ncbi:hypothetical protein SAMN06272783_3501 [Serratia sp. JKS296]|nr:hypothetical protein SAMN06272783_3501 [Serratia sp. JKS296]
MQAFVKFSVDKSEMPHVAPTPRPSQGPKARPLATRAFALSDGWLCQRYSAHPWASPLRGRCKQRSNLLQADLSSLRHTALRPAATGVPACLT